MRHLLFFWIASFHAISVCYCRSTVSEDSRSQLEDNSGIIGEDVYDTRSAILSSLGLTNIERSNRQKRDCTIGGGMSQQCATEHVDRKMNMRERLVSPRGPGKRFVIDGAQFIDYSDREDDYQLPNNDNNNNLTGNPDEGSQDDEGGELLLIRRLLRELKRMKRASPSCRFNLGGHCSTESAAFLSDLYRYLDSPESPGRKRSARTSGISRKLNERQLIDDME